MKSKEWVSLALLAGGAYLAWSVFKKNIGALTAPAAEAIANAYVDMTNFIRGSGDVVPLGAVFLSDTRQFVSTAALNIRMVPNSNTAQFTYQNKHYLIQGQSDANGNWAAIRG